MSLLTQASLILTPNAYKANKLYSIIPSSGNGDMTTTRATTATRTNSSGLVENVATGIPRIDYTSGVGSILLEPQRTNLLLNSEDFGSLYWNKRGLTTITDNTTISPSGTLDADTLNNTTGSLVWDSGNTLQRDVSGILTLTTYTFSVFVKSLGSTTFSAGLRNQSTGVIISANIVPNSEWQRITISQTTTVNTSIGLLFGNTNGNVAIWGAQLELGSYATSYIPTTTSTVTRNLDDISRTGISTDILNPSEGTFYVEISALANDLTSRIISLSDGTDYNQIAIQFSSVSNVIRLDTYGQTGVETSTNFRSAVTVSDTTTFHKCLIKWGAGGLFGYVDGVKYTLGYAAGTIGGSGIPTALNRIHFRVYWGGSPFYGKCKGMQIYKTALSDAECASLTTL